MLYLENEVTIILFLSKVDGMYHDYWILQCSDKGLVSNGLGNFMKSTSIIESTRQTYSPETKLSDRKFKRLIFIF